MLFPEEPESPKISQPLRTKVNFRMPLLPKMDTRLQIRPKLMMASDGLSEPSNLESLTFASDIIIVGRFTGVLRYAYTPFSANLTMSQNTLYAFQVETYIKGRGEPILKIYHQGGPLPWIRNGVQYEGFIEKDNPIPSVGDRYLLFLRYPYSSIPVHKQRGYVSVLINGKREVAQYLDELDFTSRLQSKILLKNGQALSGDLSGAKTYLHWRFAFGPQIIDVSEAEAIRAVRAFVSK